MLSREELARDLPAAAADRGADRELSTARGRPGELEVGYVRARDQQDEGDGARGYERSDICAESIVAHIPDAGPPVRVGLGVL